MKSTSISDTPAYLNSCVKFLQDDQLFDNFKRDSDYTSILEHTTKEQAIEYIKYIENSNIDKSKISKLRENDEQGNPVSYIYNNPLFDGMSPSTVRYIKVLSELINIYTNLDNKNIIEIGIGYGGQCKIINDYFDINSYQLVDLDVVKDLASKYLKKYNYNNLIVDNVYSEKYDLLISNYAITECDSDIQLDYFNKIIDTCNHGYVTCNFISDQFNINSLSKKEFIDRIHKKTYIQDEYPLTHPNNFIIYW